MTNLEEHKIIAQRTERDPESGNRTCSNVQSSPSAHATLSVDVGGSQSATHRHELAYQPPTCIHHLAFPRLECLWGKVSHEGRRVCVRITLGTSVGLRDGQKDPQPRMIAFKRGIQMQSSRNIQMKTTFSPREKHTRGRVRPHCQHNRFTALQVDELQAELCAGARHSWLGRVSTPQHAHPLSSPRCGQNKACIAGQGHACAQMYNTHMKTSGKLNSTSGGPRSALQATAGRQTRSCPCSPPPATRIVSV